MAASTVYDEMTASTVVYAIVEGGRWVIERSWPACAWAIGRPGARIRSFASADAAGEWAEDELRRARPRPHLELTPTAVIVGPRPAHGPDECVAALAVSAAPQTVGVGAVVTCGHHRWRGHRWLRAGSAAQAELEAAALALEAASTLGGGCTSMRLLGCSAALVSCLQRAAEAADAEDEATDAEAPGGGSGSSGGGALVARVATLVASLPARLTPCEHPTDGATYALLAEAQAEALKARVGRRSDSELLPPQPRPRTLLVPPPSLLVPPPPPGVDRPASTAAARTAGPEEDEAGPEEDVAKAAEAKAADRLLMPPPPPRVQPAPPPSHAPPSLAPPPPLRQLQEHHSNQQRSPTSAAAARASLNPKRSAPPSSDAPPSPQRRRHGAGTIPAVNEIRGAGTIPADATAPATSRTAPAATWTARAATDAPVTALEPTATAAAPSRMLSSGAQSDGPVGWSCTQCTFWHGGPQRTFLACAICGRQRAKGKRTLKRAGPVGSDGTAADGAGSSAAAAALSPKREARATAQLHTAQLHTAQLHTAQLHTAQLHTAQPHDAARAPSAAAAERELLPYEEMELLSQMRYERQLEHQMSRQPPKTAPTPSPPSPPSPLLVPAAAAAPVAPPLPPPAATRVWKRDDLDAWLAAPEQVRSPMIGSECPRRRPIRCARHDGRC
jgi:hypothetical protein